MKFDRLALRNFKCFEDADLDLERGVTVVHGINGSGKSSLLEACFFALYGATAIDRTLEEIVTLGAEETEVDLWFTHEGGSYHLHRRIRATGERAATADCTLDGPSETWTGVGDVEDQVRSMLRMDSEAFVNSAFVRQGEINKLIEASPADRKRMLDRLLQLGTLETYRERAAEARLGVENLRERRSGRLDSLLEQIEAKDESDLVAREQALQTRIGTLDAEIEELERGREEAKETLSEAESTLETDEERREELETVTERFESLRSRIAEDESQRETLANTIAELREDVADREATIETQASKLGLDSPVPEEIAAEIEAARERKETLTEAIMDRREAVQDAEHEAESARERIEELEQRAADRRERAAELDEEETTLEATIEETKGEIEDTAAEIGEHLQAFAETPVAYGDAEAQIERVSTDLDSVREDATELREDLATVRSRVQDAESLLEAGKCPECGQPVDGAPNVETLEADRERVADLESELETIQERRRDLEDALEAAERLRDHERQIDALVSTVQTLGDRLAEKRAARADTNARREELRGAAAELQEEASELEAEVEAAEQRAADRRAEIGEHNQALSEQTERVESLESLLSTVEERTDLQEQIERHQETRSSLAERNDERRETLSELRERKQALADQIDAEIVERARAERDRATEYLEQVEAELDGLREERNERQSELGAVRNELEELQTLETQREAVEETLSALESLHEELSELESMYGRLRTDLRQRNVSRLETLLNESFDLVYRNDSYARIELDEAYELTIYQKDGSPLEPDQLSGGERALFNLSLRAAIYRLLVEGIEGTAPMPPLILDEPTVFLDSGHVTQLVSLVESMRDLGVEQIIVVSHDEELIGAADDLVRVEKDPTTNRSQVESVAPALPGRTD